MPGSPLGSPDNPLRVAVIGSGPSGFYATERLLNAEDLSVQVDIYDRLPTPFGLVRGGVAPDHQKIKSVTRVFDKIAAHPEFRFFGNVEVGRDIVRDEMLAYYHGIIYAVGARTDRRMWIPREHLPGSHSATEFVGWYNAHPDYRRMRFNLQATSAAVVGNGNVAMDVARLLASPLEHLAATDISDHALASLVKSQVRDIHILGRRGPAQAAFTNKEIKELGEIPGVDVFVDPAAMELDPASQAYVDASDDKSLERNLAILRGYAEREPTGAPTRIFLHFLVSPIEILGEDSVTQLVLGHNELYVSDDGSVRPRLTDRRSTIDVGLVFRAIGYKGEPLPGLPFDDRGGVVPNVAGRVVEPTTAEPVVGEYVTGWIKRGPQGVIGTNKPDGYESADSLLGDARAGRLDKEVPSREVLERLLGERQHSVVSFEDWRHLDELERGRGEPDGRPRVKFTHIEEMLHALGQRKQVD